MSSSVCVDASLIIRIVVPGPYSREAAAALAAWQQAEVTVIAPALLAFEVTATLRRMVYLKALRPERGKHAFVQFQRIPISLSHRKSIFPLAWELAEQFNPPRAYDAAYLALAQLHDCQFWTADEKLYNAVQHELSWVQWIGNSHID